MSVTFHPYVEQGSDEWLAMRCGMLTASGRQGVTACPLNPIFPPTISPRPNEPSPARTCCDCHLQRFGSPTTLADRVEKVCRQFRPRRAGKRQDARNRACLGE